jgi:16S rRNA (adenine1518-N6/adenine1519-N6)-dimethyltransferase
VDSAVVKLTTHAVPAVAVNDIKLMFKVIKAAFAMRRKTLVNGLVYAGLCADKQAATDALGLCGLSACVRGETLGLEQFAALTDILETRAVRWPPGAEPKPEGAAKLS